MRMAVTLGSMMVGLESSAPYENHSTPFATIMEYGMIDTSPVVPSSRNFLTACSGEKKTNWSRMGGATLRNLTTLSSRA